MWPQPVSDGKWFMFLDAGGEEESWQSPLSAITVARLRGNWNINSSFCNACKWLNGIILIIIISVVVGLLLSLSGEANIHCLSDTHPHIHIHTQCLLHFFWDCYPKKTGPLSLDRTAVLCRTSKLMLMQLAQLPSSQLHFESTGSERRCVYVSVCGRRRDLEEKNRPPDLIRGKALAGNGFGTQLNCPYFRRELYIFTDINIARVTSILAAITKVVWSVGAV